jgi:hypothetical protein
MSPRILAYVCPDPDCPAELRAVAHWFDNAGRLQTATATASEPQVAAERLRGFLVCQIAKASVPGNERTPAQIAAAQARTAKARAARLAKRSFPND